MKPNIEELRKKYINNPPEGMTSKDIRRMSEEELLDMDYFLNEDDLFDDQILSFDINSDSDMAEIEALLNMAESNQPMDDNSELLKLLSDDDKELLNDLDISGLNSEPGLDELKGEFSLDSLESELDLGQLEGDFDLAQFDAELDLEQLEAELDKAFGETSNSAESEEKEDKKKGKEKKNIYCSWKIDDISAKVYVCTVYLPCINRNLQSKIKC